MASVTAVDLGTANPPTVLGGYTVGAFEPGTITGESYTAHETGGNGDGLAGYWATWGQSYTGYVHVVFPTNPLTINLTGPHAVYFYEEPNYFEDFSMTATDSSGASVTTVINGYHGSSGVGFFETNPLDTLTKITVTCTDASGFAVGEFGLDTGTLNGGIGSVPEPATIVVWSLLGTVAMAVGWWRRAKAA
jgi:hypothetical protein